MWCEWGVEFDTISVLISIPCCIYKWRGKLHVLFFSLKHYLASSDQAATRNHRQQSCKNAIQVCSHYQRA